MMSAAAHVAYFAALLGQGQCRLRRLTAQVAAERRQYRERHAAHAHWQQRA